MRTLLAAQYTEQPGPLMHAMIGCRPGEMQNAGLLARRLENGAFVQRRQLLGARPATALHSANCSRLDVEGSARPNSNHESAMVTKVSTAARLFRGVRYSILDEVVARSAEYPGK